MCVYSMIMGHYGDKWGSIPATPITTPPITPEEIAEFRELLRKAREYDKRMNQPACEDADKKETLRKLAKQLGIDISFIDDANDQ